jgi:DNA repair protein RadC
MSTKNGRESKRQPVEAFHSVIMASAAALTTVHNHPSSDLQMNHYLHDDSKHQPRGM